MVAKVKNGTRTVLVRVEPPRPVKEPPAAGFLDAREVAVLTAPLIRAASKEIRRERMERLAEKEPEKERGGPVWLWLAGGLVVGGAALAGFEYLRRMRARRLEPVTVPVPEFAVGRHRMSYTTTAYHPE